jgi:hypothetical protein
MSWLMAEALVDELITYFQANMAAKVAALNAEYADTITLSDPVEWMIGERDLASVPAYPTGYVLATRVSGQPWNLQGSGSGQLTQMLDVTIGVIDKGDNPNTLRRAAMRYARAVLELLVEGQFDASLGQYTLAVNGPLVVEYSGNVTSGSFLFSDGHVRVSYHSQEVKT